MFPEQHNENQQYERRWLKPFTDTIPEWSNLCFVRRFLAREGKQYVLWQFNGKLQPDLIDLLRIETLHISRGGPSMKIISAKGANILVGAAPQKVYDFPLFIWIPAIFDARYAPFSYEHGDPLRREVTWRFCVKMQSNHAEAQHRKIGHVHFTEIAEFRKLWPNTPV